MANNFNKHKTEIMLSNDLISGISNNKIKIRTLPLKVRGLIYSGYKGLVYRIPLSFSQKAKTKSEIKYGSVDLSMLI